MRQTTDTTQRYSNRDIEDGTYEFTIKSITPKTKGETLMYILKLEYNGTDGEQLLLPSNMGPLLKLLGAKETSPNVFDWDTEDYAGSKFSATVSHKPDRKDPTKVRQYMGHFDKPLAKEPEIPF